MRRIDKSECRFPDAVVALPPLEGLENDRQNNQISKILQHIMSDKTARYSMDQVTEPRIDEYNTLTPQKTEKVVKWPHDTPIYIEFQKRVINFHDLPDRIMDFVKGVIVLPSKSQATIFMFGITCNKLSLTEHTLDLQTGHVTIQNEVLEELRASTSTKAADLYAKLAIYMTTELLKSQASTC